MPLLTLDQASLAFGHLPLLQDVGLRIDPGERLALIGRNGSGKSTLLKVIEGTQALDAGSVWRTPGLRLARLDQEAMVPDARTVRDEVALGLPPGLPEWDIAHRVEMVLTRLSLPGDRYVAELSGGWRRRVLLGKALVCAPDLLLLDEPTNHLDIDVIQWLEEHLLTFPGALLFVTHDRAFLRRLATRIIELDRGALTSWPGDYATYTRRKHAAIESEARDLERLDKKLAQEEAWLRQGIKARRTRNEGRVRALLALRAERAAYRAQSGVVRMALDRGEASGRMAFELENVCKAYNGTPVIDGLSTRIFRGDRIGLVGPNGSGKTTLLRLLVGEIPPDAGTVRQGARLQVAYFDQQRAQLDPERSVADNVADADTVIVNGQPRHVMGYLADFLFPTERARSPVKALSGGERNRLLLARLFAQPANVLILDEPTNDLDIETLELLEELIAGFDGTVLVVTHDRVFLDGVVTSTLAFEGDGRVSEYVGGWEDYLRQRPVEARRKPDRADREATTTTAKPRVPARRKKTFGEQREYEALPARIEALEAEQSRLQQKVASPEFYKSPPDHIVRVLARIDEIHAAVEDALARWVELEEIGT